MKYLVLFLIIILSLTSCKTQVENTLASHVINAPQITRNTDWYKQDMVSLIFNDINTTKPEMIKVTPGKPYKMELTNTGNKTACFESRGFFDSIATYKVSTEKDTDVQTPYVERILIRPKGTAYLWFVPLISGEYNNTCTKGLQTEAKLIIR